MNTFYRQHEFPRPDPDSAEPSMGGVDPYSCGFGQGDIMFCQLSPLHEVTLDDEGKEAAGIPKETEYFAWAYPMVDDGSLTAGTSPEHMFVQLGGYVYFDATRNVVATKSIIPAPLGTLAVMFGRAQSLRSKEVETLTRQGRFQDVTQPALMEKGVTHFAWIRPGEFAEGVASENGCFAYKFASGRGEPVYFPLVNKPIYTSTLLEEELDDSEAWAVVRTAHPRIEEIFIFDKSKDFNQNLRGVRLHSELLAEDSKVTVSREGSPRGTYSEWQASQERGTIANPWIFYVKSG